MSNYTILYDAYLIDDADRLICTAYVDLRKTAERPPITTLVKGCANRYAIEDLRKVRISKPEQFRECGDGLIRDPSEAQASHIEIVERTVDDLHHLPEGQPLAEAVARTSEELQVSIEITALSTRVSRKTTDSMVYGKNGWIFSTSIEPTNPQEWSKWQASLPEDYDHVSYIRRPREFSRALGLMVAEQLGPQGQKAEMDHSFEGAKTAVTRHKGQFVFHGPVIYVEDPYVTIANAPSESDAMFRSVFVKGMKYRDQREYRFVIWAEREPSNQYVDLAASLALLGAMETESSGRG